MTRRRRLILLALLAALAVAAWSYRMSRSAPFPEKRIPGAFVAARWGMSPSEVERVNGLALRPPSAVRRFYRSEPGSEGRFKTLEASGQRFLGREASVSYTFKDDRLFTVHVFIADENAETLDADMRRYLGRVFGPRSNAVEEDSSLKEIWHFDDRMVNYWFYEDDLAVRRRFKAGFGVIYKPIESD